MKEEQLPEGVFLAPSVRCKWCGVDAECIGGVEQPHRCRIDIDEQRKNYETA